MRFLGVGEDASLGDMYLKLAEAGNEVRVFIRDPTCQDTLQGMLNLSGDWERDLDWIRADNGIVIFEDTNMGGSQDSLRRDGFNVIGGSAFGDRLENDREFGQQRLREAGLATARTYTFNNFLDAIDFINRRPQRYVFKLNGNSFASSRNCVGELNNGADIKGVLNRYATTWTFDERPDFVLMDFVDGVEVGVGAYFNGQEFMDAVVIDWEHKRFFPGDLGELTGEMGTLLSYRGSMPLFGATLQKMTPQLRASNYVGYINLNTIVNKEGIWPLEFTCRFGYPGAAICESLHEEGWHTLFSRLCSRDTTEFRTAEGFSVGVLLTVPSFPQGDRYDEISKGLPILFRTQPSQDELRHYHLSDVEKRADGQLYTGGELGSLMIVTGCGLTVEAAQAEAYVRCRNVVVPGLRYRADIGDRFVKKDHAALKELGLFS